MLVVEGLWKAFGKKAVLKGVDFAIASGEVTGLLGESGSGKTTIARCVLGLEQPSRGRITWSGQPITASVSRHAWRKDIQIVFQDPRTSLDPRWTIRRSLHEPLSNWFPWQTAAERHLAVEGLMEQVGLGVQYLDCYPHELSTGQCQRACIARALAPQPKLLVLDEPLSALDVTIQAQILRLLRHIRQSQGLSYLFISHDIAVVAELCERILVLDKGEIVEEASNTDLLERPQHPYTRALISDAPSLPWSL